jgi:peptidoglycan/LPS O-acetylase OafA/YrhL
MSTQREEKKDDNLRDNLADVEKGQPAQTGSSEEGAGAQAWLLAQQLLNGAQNGFSNGNKSPTLPRTNSQAAKEPAGPKKLRKTAWMDGLRGWAAFLVYILHNEMWAHESSFFDHKLESVWGYKGNYSFATFHGIRTFVTGGHFAVAIFFFLSGYVLSLKPLSLIHAGQYVTLGENVSSALFRRWLRLMMPIFITTFISMVVCHVLDFKVPFHREKTLYDEIWQWYLDIKNFTFIFTTGDGYNFLYNPHSWSIPIEMRGSIGIYTTLMAVSRLTRRNRLIVFGVLIWYYMWVADGAYFAMFTGGMLICDMEMLYEEGNLPTWITDIGKYKNRVCYTMFFIAIWLGGVPGYSIEVQVLRDSPTYYWISFLKPQAVFDTKWFYLFFAAGMLVIVTPRLPWLKAFFETRFCQFLGRVSYMLYLFHGPILWTFGDHIYAAVGWTKYGHGLTAPAWINIFELPKWGFHGFELSFLAAQLIICPLTLWIAYLATIYIDDPCLEFAAKLYRRLQPQTPEERQRETQVNPAVSKTQS